MFIGVDDTDSDKGLCTTYLAAVLMERLEPLGNIRSLPKLIRLNPCARFKTRGNAAIAFELETDRPEEARETALQTVEEFSDLSGENTNPGLVAADKRTPEMKEFYQRAVKEILEISEAKEILEEQGVWYRGFKKGRGLIGALAAVGADLSDHTYELIAYRHRENWGTPRKIDWDTAWDADRQTYPGTWDTVDCHNRRVIFAPHSSDPVLFGIRGDDIAAIKRAFDIIRSEPVERKVLYLTNQGTDAHIIQGEIAGAIDDQSYRLTGRVTEAPRAIYGGHTFFSISDGDDSMACAAFEPTKNFRSIINKLAPGDLVEVYGAVRNGTLNIEKMNILELAERSVLETPICPSCKRRMESAGKNQGYRCKRCKTKAQGRERKAQPRDLEEGFYEVPPCARRHLSKQLIRMKAPGAHPGR